MKYFYSHLIEIESLTIRLEELNLSDSQRLHLTSLLDSTIHQTVLDIILSKLSPVDKVAFVERLRTDPEDHKMMDFLSARIENIEGEISRVIDELKQELHEDLKEAVDKNG